jgi:hypothetical protein
MLDITEAWRESTQSSSRLSSPQAEHVQLESFPTKGKQTSLSSNMLVIELRWYNNLPLQPLQLQATHTQNETHFQNQREPCLGTESLELF